MSFGEGIRGTARRGDTSVVREDGVAGGDAEAELAVGT